MIIINNLFSPRNAFRAIKVSGLVSPINEEQRKQLQSTILDVYKDILNVCHDINATPFLVGGSALGAVRHEGFIPWDDDLDIGMMRSEYEEFLDVFQDRFRDKYFVNSAGRSVNAKARFTKIFKKGTICKEMISPKDDNLNGIFVDLFPIDNVPNNIILRKLKGHYCNLLEYISSQVYYSECMDEESRKLIKEYDRVGYYLRDFIGKIFGLCSSSQWFAKINKFEQSNDIDSMFCTLAAGRKHYFGEMIERSIIMPPKYLNFNGIKAPVFHNVEKYLSNLYGDYMEIPPIEKRESHMVKELSFGNKYSESIKKRR